MSFEQRVGGRPLREAGPKQYLFSAIVGRLTAEFSARFYLFAGFRQEPALRSRECLLPN
jgi:hypothetical protein